MLLSFVPLLLLYLIPMKDEIEAIQAKQREADIAVKSSESSQEDETADVEEVEVPKKTSK